MFLSSAIITVHLENLRHNLKTLLARHPSLMPVIKADAYGHGVVAVARVLAEEGIQHMAVGSVGEGALLRQEGHTAFLLALMGLARDEDTALAASYDITPLVHSRESLERILAQSHLTGRAKPLTVAIKFDTGMSRLGFRVDEAAELVEQSGVDILAVGIGTAHGFYQGKPELNFERLRQVNEAIDIPLVLHGGTGIPQEDVREAIRLGVNKVNVGTIIKYVYLSNVQKMLNENPKGPSIHTIDLMLPAVEAIKAEVKRWIRVCMSNGKA